MLHFRHQTCGFSLLNNVSANNAIFSNVTDRLAIFENSLKSSLEKQEDYVANSSSQLFEQIKNIK